ncbi:hypothetical protein AYO45_04180 [Gammaproteobacteria bacterium SCGC AG-212-F23]|nr:hypothetical protein AYO45_04180 [Gammaproteobacteria bacterium SCGC AG-212-F23]
MINSFQRQKKGFTLVEMLLVLVIMSIILSMLIGYTQQKMDQLRRDRTSLMMQQILNAALSYYVNNGKWPANHWNGGGDPFVVNYLGNRTWKNPWGGTFDDLSANGIFYLCTIIPSTGSSTTAIANAAIIAGSLPNAYTSSNNCSGVQPPAANNCSAGQPCYVVSAVQIPGQNLNNARSVNFADLYNSGACVPQPTCPTGMVGAVFTVPAAVSGVNDTGSLNTYPVSSFTSYATGAWGSTLEPPICNEGANEACLSAVPPPLTSFNGTFWRACLSVTTEKGVVNNMAQKDTVNVGKILVITRCVPADTSGLITEPRGGDIGIYY